MEAQLMLLPETEVDKLKAEVDNLRKGCFARIGELTKTCLRQQIELDEIKKKLEEGAMKEWMNIKNVDYKPAFEIKIA